MPAAPRLPARWVLSVQSLDCQFRPLADVAFIAIQRASQLWLDRALRAFFALVVSLLRQTQNCFANLALIALPVSLFFQN